MEAVVEAGKLEGLTYNFPPMGFGDTTDAHVLIKSPDSGEARDRLMERLYLAATTEGLNIFDRSVLAILPVSAGERSNYGVTRLGGAQITKTSILSVIV